MTWMIRSCQSYILSRKIRIINLSTTILPKIASSPKYFTINHCLSEISQRLFTNRRKIAYYPHRYSFIRGCAASALSTKMDTGTPAPKYPPIMRPYNLAAPLTTTIVDSSKNNNFANATNSSKGKWSKDPKWSQPITKRQICAASLTVSVSHLCQYTGCSTRASGVGNSCEPRITLLWGRK